MGRFWSFVSVRGVHQAGRFVEQVFEKREAELFEDMPRRAVIGVVPGIDFGQLQLAPAVIERALRRFHREAVAPAAFYDVKAELEIRLAGGIDPRPQPAAPDKI